MGLHVDTTRPEDAPGLTPYGNEFTWQDHPQHRADREHWGPPWDVWSGDPDTDKAWAHEWPDTYNRTGILR